MNNPGSLCPTIKAAEVLGDKWTLLFLAGGMGVLLVNGLLERIPSGTRLRPILFAAPFVLLILLDAAIPFLYTIPQLGR